METAAYCLEARSGEGHSTFFRLLAHEDKAAALASAVVSARELQPTPLVFTVSPHSLRTIPGAPFAYWIDGKVRSLFSRYPSLESSQRRARRGASTGDDARRVRCWWEVHSGQIGRDKRWVPFAKGGAYSPYHADVYLLVGWDEKRRTFEGFYGRAGRMIERPEALDFFFRLDSHCEAQQADSAFVFFRQVASSQTRGQQSSLPTGQILPLWGSYFLKVLNGSSRSALLRGRRRNPARRGEAQVGVFQRLPWPQLSSVVCFVVGEEVDHLVPLDTRGRRNRRDIEVIQPHIALRGTTRTTRCIRPGSVKERSACVRCGRTCRNHRGKSRTRTVRRSILCPSAHHR